MSFHIQLNAQSLIQEMEAEDSATTSKIIFYHIHAINIPHVTIISLNRRNDFQKTSTNLARPLTDTDEQMISSDFQCTRL